MPMPQNSKPMLLNPKPMLPKSSVLVELARIVEL